MGFEFSEVITTEAQFRGVIEVRIAGCLGSRSLPSTTTAARSSRRARSSLSRPVMARGTWTSPRGDPPGFVRVLDDETLAIPDRPGNRRADTFCNLLKPTPTLDCCSWYPGSKRLCGLMELLSLCGTNGSANRWAWLASSPSLRS